jgi:hypothetical protein
MPPTRAQPVTQTLLCRALDRIGQPYTHRDGDLYAVIPSRERPDAYLQVWFLIDGQTDKIFRLSCLVQPPIPWQNVPEAMFSCESYHENFRFGRLYLWAEEGQSVTNLRFEGQIDVTDGVSEAFLGTYIASHLANICAFLAQALRDTPLFGDHPPKPNQ